MQHQKKYIITLVALLLLYVTIGAAQKNWKTEQPLLDSLDQANTGLEHAYWLKELAFFHKSDRPATAHSYASRSLEIAQQLKDQKAIADAIHVDGIIFWYQGKVAEASKAFFKALEIRESINDSLELARSYNNIGNVYSWQNNYREAALFYGRSLDLRRALKDSSGMVYSMVSLAEVAARQDSLKEAERYGRQALNLARTIKASKAEAFCYEQLGRIMLSKNQLDEALEYFMDAAAINKKAGNLNQLAENYYEMAAIKSMERAHQSAIGMLRQSIDLSRTIDANDLEAAALKSLSENFAALENYDSAYFYRINHERVYEKITGEKQARILFDVQEQYRSQLEQTGLLIQQQKRTRQLILLSVASAILLASFLYFIIIKNRRLQRTERQLKEKADEIERVNKALAVQNEDLRNSNDSLREFTYVASHDLREPLRTIGSFTTLLARRFPGHLDEQSKEYIEFIVRGTKHMSLLLDGLLSYASVSNTESIELEPVQLNMIIEDVFEILNAEIVATNAQVEVDNLPQVLGNRALLSQLFQNLIANALKFNDKAERRVWVRYKEMPEMHQITVEDNGIGIDEAFKSKVFQIFHRLEKNKYKGTGLGLAICQKVVARHRGKIELESVLGEGTRFLVYLPK
jgi:signal transduction histidine kinase